MKEQFVDHLFSKIAEGRNEKALAARAVGAKIGQLEEWGERIREHSGEEARQHVLGYREVKRALEQCKDFIENSSSPVTEADFSIYVYFAKKRMLEAESIIDKEFPEFGL